MSAQPETSHYLLVFRHPEGLPQPSPEEREKVFAKWGEWIGGLRGKGICTAGHPLDDRGSVLRGLRGAKVTDGPFVEGKEVVGGYIVVKARDLASAVDIAKDCPGFETGHSVEVRPVVLANIPSDSYRPDR